MLFKWLVLDILLFSSSGFCFPRRICWEVQSSDPVWDFAYFWSRFNLGSFGFGESRKGYVFCFLLRSRVNFGAVAGIDLYVAVVMEHAPIEIEIRKYGC